MTLQRYEARTMFDGTDYTTTAEDDGPFCLSCEVEDLERRNAELVALLRSVRGYSIEHLVDCAIVVDSDPCSCGQRRLIFGIDAALAEVVR